MFSFLKRKVKGTEVGLGFFDSVRKARIAGYPGAKELFPSDAIIGLEAVKDEWLYLNVFTIDYVVFLALGQSPEKTAVLTPFWAEIKKWLQQVRVNARPEMVSFLGDDHKIIPAESSETSFERLTRRMQQYSDCILKPHHLGENYSVAVTFTWSLCGDMNAATIAGISSFFSAQKIELVKGLKSYRIVA
jgi:hypothetical protein